MRADLQVERLHDLIENKNISVLTNIFLKVPSIDIAEACNELDDTDLIWIFRAFPSKYTAELFDELEQETKERLVAGMTNKELVEIINEQSADDIADVISDMPASLTTRILKAADKEMRSDINRLLNYKEDTAGAIMTTEYLEFTDTDTVDDTIDEIRERGKDAETVYTIFVKNKNRKFVGTVDLDDLIFAKKTQTLREIMNQDIVYVRINTDKEEAGKMFRRYDLNALAVLNDDDCLTGIITIDDAVDVLTEETTEDIQKMNAVNSLEDEYLKTKPWTMAKKCVPWILLLIVLGTFSSMVLSGFQDKLGSFTSLAVFMSVITVITDTGGNAGGQSNALMVRGLALNEFGPKDFLKILWKEIKNAFCVGLCVLLFSIFWFTFEQYFGIIKNPALEGASIWNGQIWTLDCLLKAGMVSCVVGVALFAAVFVAKIVGICLPLIAASLKKDPALMSAPFITTVVDVISLLIYFGLIILFAGLIGKVEVDPEEINSVSELIKVFIL